jgi:hypothetical protein
MLKTQTQTQTQRKSAKMHNTQKQKQKQYLKQSKIKRVFYTTLHAFNTL